MKSLSAIIIITFFFASAFAQVAGDLDNSFGVGGKVIDWFPGGSTWWGEITATAIQPDGKILIGGVIRISALYSDCIVSRYNVDGSIDSSFNGSGWIIVGGETSCVVFSLSVQEDWKIVVCEFSDPEYSIKRFSSDGSIDTSFTINSYSNSFAPTSVGLQSDYKIVAGGSIGPNSVFEIARYDSNGIIDTSFNSTGFVTTVIGSASAINSLAIQSDGKIVAAGASYLGANADFALARYNPNGSLDSSFDQDGIVTTSVIATYGINSMSIQPDGKILVSNAKFNYSNDDLYLVRYNSNGTLDTTFGTDGILDINSFGYTASFALQADGKIIAAGTTPTYLFALIGLNNNGTIDTSFGSNGITTTDFDGANSVAKCMSIEPDGKIVVAGDNGLIELARYLSSLNVGIINFSSPQSSTLIYPNPIHQTETLEYTLTKNESLTIALYDVNGKLIRNFISNEQRTSGEHKETLNIGELTSGNYFLTLSNGGEKMSVKIVKQ
ncbi:MAG TPA: T9SS type A sorting domain-containing protein [Chitinophagales bacterium]|nr:T9SS type A sorting domain-containing protein [Chitinophagales bacterium]